MNEIKTSPPEILSSGLICLELKATNQTIQPLLQGPTHHALPTTVPSS